MTLTASQKARYWDILIRNCRQYVGSAGLGNKAYQHLGIVFGKPDNAHNSGAAVLALTKFAATDACSASPSDLFDAVINTHVVRAAWTVTNGGAYFEFWSAYANVAFEASEASRDALIVFLNRLQ